MQAVRLAIIAGLLITLAGCGASNNTSSRKSADELPEIEAWYLLEVGGRPETGRSHYYRLNLKPECIPDSIHFEDASLPFKKMDDAGLWEAYRHFGPDEEVPFGNLSATLRLTCSGKALQVTTDSIYLKESIILP